MCTDGLAVDWLNDKLYYLNACGSRIEVLDLANYDRIILATDIIPQLYQSNIVLDPVTRSALYMYNRFSNCMIA